MLGSSFCALYTETHVSSHDRQIDCVSRLLSITGKNFSTPPNWLNHMIKKEAEKDKAFSLSGVSIRSTILFLAFFSAPFRCCYYFWREGGGIILHRMFGSSYLQAKRDFLLALTGAELYSGYLQSPVLTERTVMNSDKC